MTSPNKFVSLACFLFAFAAPLEAKDLFDCIVEVEMPRGFNHATKGEIGPAQIRPILIADLNRIYSKRFSEFDAFSLAKSREMFWLYTNYYILHGHYQDTPYNRALIWHYGPRGPRTHPTSSYAERVCALLAAYGSR